jgi:GNAT superfamily N-acetyltransferase
MFAAVTFSDLQGARPGMLSAMLIESYGGLLAEAPEYWNGERRAWEDYDRDVFAEIDTIGSCIFLTCLDAEPIGFASFDPRQLPDVGVVGHNCVLPGFQGNGYGRLQLREVMRRLTVRGAQTIQAITGEHPFFLPARKMYAACGFHEISRGPGGPDPRYGIITYEFRAEFGT